MRHLRSGFWSRNLLLWQILHQPVPVESAKSAWRTLGFRSAVVWGLLFSVLLPFQKGQGIAECSFSAARREVRFSVPPLACQTGKVEIQPYSRFRIKSIIPCMKLLKGNTEKLLFKSFFVIPLE